MCDDFITQNIMGKTTYMFNRLKVATTKLSVSIRPSCMKCMECFHKGEGKRKKDGVCTLMVDSISLDSRYDY